MRVRKAGTRLSTRPAQNGDRESAEALLEAGADPAATTEAGKTAADLAAAAGHDDLADFVSPTPMR